jgi:MinD-like ATPase involved in chromosome partitioning or flagellar assembly
MKDRNLVIVGVNGKGGVGKTMVGYNWVIGGKFNGNSRFMIELDSTGNMAERFPKLATFIAPNKNFEIPKGMDVYIDMGGYEDHREDYLLEKANLIIVPFVPSYENVITTVRTLERIKHHKTPFLFVANMVNKTKKTEKLIDSAITEFRKVLGNRDVELFTLPQSEGLRTAVNANVSVQELSIQGGIKGKPYRAIAGKVNELDELIESFR